MLSRQYIGDRTYAYCITNIFRIVQRDNEPFYFPQEPVEKRNVVYWNNYSHPNNIPIVGRTLGEALQLAIVHTNNADVLSYAGSQLDTYNWKE